MHHMKTRNIITSIITIIFLFSIVSCSDDFLDVEPKNNLTEASYYQTEDHAIEAITACYDPLKHPSFFNIGFFFMFETWSDRAVHESPTFNKMAISATNDYPFFLYVHIYKGIYRCNTALDKIPEIEMDEDLKARLLAEAKFLRAFYNFYATVVYYEPPLLLDVPEDLNIELSNTDNYKFFEQIEKDLLEAVENLPVEYDAANRGRATKGAAYALLGKSFLYKASHAPANNINDDFSKAKQYLSEVKKLEDQGRYGLITAQGTDSLDYCYAYQCNFSAIDLTTPVGKTYNSENNMESLFEVQFHYGGWEVWEGGWQADGSLTSLYFGPDGYRNMVPTAEYVEEVFEEAPPAHPAGLEKDPRRYVTIYETGDTIYYLPETEKEPVAWLWPLHTNPSISDQYGWQKYFSPAHVSNNGPTNLRIIRYSDVLLMLAEAEFHLNGSTDLALECVNKVRQRVGLETLDVLTKEDIMHERDVEFGFEFLRFHDLVRWSMLPNPWVNIEEVLADQNFIKGKHEYLPIPTRELNLHDGALKQNPGW